MCNAIRDSSNPSLQKISSKISSVDLRLLWYLICGVYNLLLYESRLLLLGQSEMMETSTSGLATNVLMIETVAWDGEASWYLLPRGCYINLVIYIKNPIKNLISAFLISTNDPKIDRCLTLKQFFVWIAIAFFMFFLSSKQHPSFYHPSSNS